MFDLEIVKQHSPKVIAISETWLDSSKNLNTHFSCHKAYEIYRTDRKNRDGGGVALFVNEEFHSYSVESCCFGEIDTLWVMTIVGGVKYLMAVVYRPPNTDSQCLSLLTCQVKQMLQKYPSANPIIFGDFNLSGIDWVNETAPNAYGQADFLTEMIGNYMHQYVTSPTNGLNILDLVFSTEPFLFNNVEHYPPLGNSDHDVIKLSLPTKDMLSQSVDYRRDWSSVNFDAINMSLEAVNWDELFSTCPTVDSVWNEFRRVLDNLIEVYVPLKEVKKVSKNYVPKSLRKLQNKKKAAHQDKKLNPHNSQKSENFRKASKTLRKAVKTYYFEKEQEILADNNAASFFKYATSKFKFKPTIAILNDGNNGANIVESNGKAELLNTYFASVFTTDNGVLPIIPRLDLQSLLEEVFFDADSICETIKTFNNSRSRGPDMYPPFFLKKIAKNISRPLCTIFAVSLSSQTVPVDWKLANVTAIYKGKGSRHDPKSYRPISLTSVVCKIMEKIIRKAMFKHLDLNNLISSSQHGFRSAFSTTTQLLDFLEWVTKRFDVNDAIDVIYLDIAKAFDSVSHPKLIARLSQYGIRGSLLGWLTNFLSGRRQRVGIDGTFSQWESVTSGVPQGTVLGPILFLIYINELAEIANPSNVKLYADDAKIYGLANTPQQTQVITQSLAAVDEWTKMWQLQLATGKCGVMHIGTKNRKVDYFLGGSALMKLKSVEDLGVTICDSLNPHDHVSKVVGKASSRVGLLFRGFRTRDPIFLTNMFKTYVRPVLEYCSPVWSPWQIESRKQIEAVQRRFTKRITSLKNLSYEERLGRVDLEPLSVRRCKADLVETFKIFNGDYPVEPTLFFQAPFSHRTRGHEYKIYVPRTHKDPRKHFFSSRVVESWNKLPDSAVLGSTSITSFKNSLDGIICARDDFMINPTVIS